MHGETICLWKMPLENCGPENIDLEKKLHLSCLSINSWAWNWPGCGDKWTVAISHWPQSELKWSKLHTQIRQKKAGSFSYFNLPLCCCQDNPLIGFFQWQPHSQQPWCHQNQSGHNHCLVCELRYGSRCEKSHLLHELLAPCHRKHLWNIKYIHTWLTYSNIPGGIYCWEV